ncbi:MAG: transporter [Planctomycetes bacterium]|nr:transporter [Planctomycetota bacterium]
MDSVNHSARTVRRISIFLTALMLTSATANRSLAEGPSYGPCDCKPRGTLMQWSHGTSFSGGPDLDAPLVTDRPDFTEASSTVGLGVAQLEFGYTYIHDDAGGGQSLHTQSFGEPLLRVGILADWLEFRIALAPQENRSVAAGITETTAGADELYLGFKIALTPQEGLLPEMAIIPQMNVPLSSSAPSSGSVEPGVNWIYAWEINDFISTAGSTQGNRRIDSSGDAYLEMAQSWTIAYSLSDRVGAYTEWFALIPSGADTAQTEHYANGGFTFLLSNDVQWDIRAGLGLNDAAADFFAGTGLSIRFH